MAKSKFIRSLQQNSRAISMALDSLEKLIIIKNKTMQDEQQFLFEQFEKMPVELQRQLITLGQHFQKNVEDYKRVFAKASYEAEDKTHALTKGAVCIYVLIALDETKPVDEVDTRHISTHIDRLYNHVKKHR